MKAKLSLVLSGILSVSVVHSAAAETSVIKAGKVLDVVSGKVLDNRFITVEDGVIQSVSSEFPASSRDLKLIDLSDNLFCPA